MIKIIGNYWNSNKKVYSKAKIILDSKLGQIVCIEDVFCQN